MVIGGLVVIGNFYLACTPGFPQEADTPLVIDADAMLPGPIAPEHLQTVARWYAEGFKAGYRVEDVELVDGTLVKISWETGALPVPEFLRLLIAEAFNQHENVRQRTE